MMFETRIPIQPGLPLTFVELAQDATVTSWDETDVMVRLRGGQEGDLNIDSQGEGLDISSKVPCEVYVPSETEVTVRQALGNLKVKGLAALNAEQVRGNLHLSNTRNAVIAEVYGGFKAAEMASLRMVGTIYGDAHLSSVSAVNLQNVRGNLLVKLSDQVRASRVAGNLQAKEVSGTLDGDQVGGNALLKSVGGIVALDQVAGNLNAKDLVGGAKISRIGGNLLLNGELGSGCTYHFWVDGNALLRLSEGANAHMTLSAKGRLQSSVELDDAERTERSLTGTMGHGGAEVVIEAKGNLLLGGGQTFSELGDEISRQVEETLKAIDFEAIGQQVNQEVEEAMSRLRVKLETMDWDRVGHKARTAVERAMERLQRDMDRWAASAARHQERVERTAAREARHRARTTRRMERVAQRQRWPGAEEDMGSAQAPEASVSTELEPDLDEERLSILRMVEQGQIAPEEAELLLDVLQ